MMRYNPSSYAPPSTSTTTPTGQVKAVIEKLADSLKSKEFILLLYLN